MKDICYKCEKSQDYGTMQDINQTSFAIFCDDCLDAKEESK